jgi:glycosyltransferase involved in cell wall biosynthesis
VRGLIVGEPEHTPENAAYYQKLLTLTETLGLKENVRFTGFRKDVPRLMGALDVMVLGSSEPEPFGRVVIEAMAAERPVIATAAGGVLDIIEHGVNGWLIPAKDVLAMTHALTKLLSEQDLAHRIGQAARHTVEERFTLATHVECVQAVYDVVLRNKTTAAVSLSAAKSLSV